MEISSAFTGTRLKPLTTRVTARDTMNYAAAINDNNPCYFDDRRDGKVAAHPLNPVAITWKITGSIWEFIEADDFPLEALLTQVHHTETIVHHRPLVPGDTLTVNGTIAVIEPHRAGTRVVIRYEAADEKQRPVFTEYCGALLRGVACTDGGCKDGDLPVIPSLEGASGPLWNAAVEIDPLRPYLYDGCTDIVFPIHTSPKFAGEVGLPGIILQGTATLALAVREIVDREADRQPASIRLVSCRFTGMVLPGTCIDICLIGRRDTLKGKALFFEVRDSAGQKAISDGFVEVASKP
jgi:acyl dehydratase